MNWVLGGGRGEYTPKMGVEWSFSKLFSSMRKAMLEITNTLRVRTPKKLVGVSGHGWPQPWTCPRKITFFPLLPLGGYGSNFT